MSSRSKKKFRLPVWMHGPMYSAVRLASAAVQVTGINTSLRALRKVGGAFAEMPFNSVRLQRAIDNISWCFPHWDDRRVRAHAVEAYRHLFALAAEISITPRLLSRDGYANVVEIGELKSALDDLLCGRPAILITGHCGNWELLGGTLAALGFPVHALYRPLDMKPLDDWMHRTRSRRGLILVDKFGATERLPSLLEQGLPVGFIADQNAGDRGLFVPFFNRLASTYKTIGLLAQRYDAPVICGHARRLSGIPHADDAMAPEADSADEAANDSQLFRYRLDVVDVIRPDDWKDRPDPLFYITARYRRAIEAMVRRAPEQYLWMHRYWKSRPVHEREGRPFPARLREKLEQLPWMTATELERIVRRSAQDAEEYRRRTQPGPNAVVAPSTH